MNRFARSARGWPSAALAVAVLTSIQVVGCAATSAPRQTQFMREQTELEVSAEELRIRVRSLVMAFSGMIEEAADELEASTTDPELHRVALRWKTDVIPAVQSALFDPDPLVALLDTWALIAQLRLYLEQGPGAGVPVETRSRALAAVDRMEAEIERITRSIAQPGGTERVRTRVHAWAEDNPIETHFTSRRSVTSDLAGLTAEANPGIRQALGGLTLGLGDVWERLDAYSAYLPKQARWQAELLVNRALSGEEVGGALGDFSDLTRAIDQIAATVEQAPGLLAREREAALQALQVERIATLESLNRELLGTLDRILETHVQTADDLVSRERAVLLEAVTAERVAALEALHDERVDAIDDLERIAGGLGEIALRRLVDHAFVRLLQLLGIIAVVGLLGAVLYTRAFRR